MRTLGISRIGNVVSLDALRERRKYIAIAHAAEHWQQTRASFALSGIDLTDVNAERARLVIAGVLTVDQIRDEILRSLK